MNVMRNRGAPFDAVGAVLADRQERRRTAPPAPRFDARKALMEDRKTPRRTLSVREAEAALSTERSPDQTPGGSSPRKKTT
jgi:hypothetical protein